MYFHYKNKFQNKTKNNEELLNNFGFQFEIKNKVKKIL